MTSITIKVPNWLDLLFAWPAMVYRKHRYGYAYRRIDLGEGRHTILDPPDFYRLNNFRWYAEGEGELIYALRTVISAREKSRTVRMHRLIMNAPANRLVDHRNGDGLDNRRENLRLATPTQNMQNRRKTRRKTSSRFVGPTFVKRRGDWSSRLSYKGKRIWLGYFDSEVEAAKAYDKAARKYHKEFARLNFPEEASGVQNISS
jgi:hypothetical protein